jgi:hypothetical protein
MKQRTKRFKVIHAIVPILSITAFLLAGCGNEELHIRSENKVFAKPLEF